MKALPWSGLLVSTALIALMWQIGGGDAPIDLSLVKAARGWTVNHPGAESMAIVITQLGSARVLVPLAVVAACWLGWRKRWYDAGLMLATTLGGRLIIEGMKVAIGRPRPELDPHPVTVSSFSFPSGHAGNSMLTFLTLALLLPRENRPGLVALAVIASVIIGATRPMLGVHWPSDVIGGWSFGIMWTMLCVALFRRDRTAA